MTLNGKLVIAHAGLVWTDIPCPDADRMAHACGERCAERLVKKVESECPESRLIAAAPELLAACKALVETVDSTGGIVVEDNGLEVPAADKAWCDLAVAYRMAQAAIAKAECIQQSA